MKTKITTSLLTAFAVLAMAAAPANAASDIVTNSAGRAATWLITKQSADGGFSNGFAKGSDVSATADAVFALAGDASAKKNVASALNFLAAQVPSGKLKTGQYVKIALAAKAAGANPRAFGGKDLLAEISKATNPKTGVIGDGVFTHALAVLALARGGASVPAQALTALEALQTPAGGWAFTGAGAPDVDTTALAVQALIAAGRPSNSGAAGRGLGYLRGLQNTDGGFPYQSPSAYGTDSNANSTALVAQAIIAAGDQPESWAAAQGNPLSALVNLQQKSGAIAFQSAFADDNILATVGAIAALNRKGY
ncbi:MAG TPA: hypothetical protein PLJ62_02930 [Thermoflexales bacterium]|nr:hypothetical protein [Thermoflexales bacterium]